MIDRSYVQRMAQYNRWQNENLYGAADTLSDDERTRERGAFFGTIPNTLNHLLWADRMWLSRFTGAPRPSGSIAQSLTLYPDWSELKRERVATDTAIIEWAGALDAEWLNGDLAWHSGAVNAEVRKPKWELVVHMFNHQTHHRGQVHGMLTQAGAKPGATDIWVMPAA